MLEPREDSWVPLSSWRMWRVQSLTLGPHLDGWVLELTEMIRLNSLSLSAREIQLLLNYNPLAYFIHHLMLFDYLSLISFYNSKCFSEEIKLPWSPSVRNPFHWNSRQRSSVGFSSGRCGSSLQSLIEKTWSKAQISSPFGLYPCCFSSLLVTIFMLQMRIKFFCRA